MKASFPKWRPLQMKGDVPLWWAIFGFSLALRLVYLWQSQDNPLFGHPVVDAQAYENWARQMAWGQWRWHYVHNYLPVYPAFLALQKLLAGHNPWVNKLLQILMGSGSAVLMAQVARHVWDRRTALFTGLLLGSNWLLVVYEGEKYAEPFSLFFLSLTLWLLVCCRRTPKTVLMAGLALALSAGSRANLFLLLPFFLVWLIWWDRTKGLSRGAKLILFGLGTVLVIGPIVHRNYRLSGAPLLRAQAGWSLYAAVTPRFGGLHPPPGIKFKKEIRRPFAEGLRRTVELEQYWFRRARAVIDQHPGRFLQTQLKRGLMFCNVRQWSQEFDVYAYRQYAPVLRWTAPAFWLLIPFGILGLGLAGQKSAARMLLLGCLVLSVISIFPFKVSDRYRLPTLLLLTPWAAVALARLPELAARLVKDKNARIAAVALLVLLGLCWPDWAGLADQKTARHAYFVGLAKEAEGDLAAAQKAYHQSLQTYAWDPDSPYRLARIWRQSGSPEKAGAALNLALKREPVFPEALVAKARLALERHQPEAAEAHLQTALRYYPNCQPALLLAVRLYRSTGQVKQELACYQKAVKEARYPSVRAGNMAAIALGLSLRLEELQKPGAAVGQLEKIMGSPQPIRPEKRSLAAILAGLICTRAPSQSKAASNYWRQIASLAPEPSFWRESGRFLTGKLTPAEYTNRLKVQTDPEKRQLGFYLLGRHHRQKGCWPAAQAAFQKSLLLAPAAYHPIQSPLGRWAREAMTAGAISQSRSEKGEAIMENQKPQSGLLVRRQQGGPGLSDGGQGLFNRF